MRQTWLRSQVILYATSMPATKFINKKLLPKKSNYLVRIAQLAHTKSIFVWINLILRSNFNNTRKLSIKQRQSKPNYTQFRWKGR